MVHDVKAIANGGIKDVILDANELKILDVSAGGKPLQWEFMAESKPFGQPLKISLPQPLADGESIHLAIDLETTERGTALQFMTPTQAKSKKPYVFSQGQAINNRSLFPCQDTPAVKATYDFNITSPLPVIASGIAVEGGYGVEVPGAAGKLYKFRQEIPIPSYLFAIASGDLESAPIGPRSVVTTAPEGLKAAQWEFEQDTEHFIQEIEKVVYPYQWGTYNLLVLPPSAPFGGMENPVWTYVTPTLISGDRENVNVIAHELSHSFSGNLVTASSWADFWLNEGWTVYLERRLLAAVYGEPYRDFAAIIGWQSLVHSVENYGAGHEFTKLVPDMKGKHPDDAFSTVPYEKGYTFLSYLEGVVGRPHWNEYIQHYFHRFARLSIDSLGFKEDVMAFFAKDPEASKSMAAVDWNSWYYGRGLPPKPRFDTSMVEVCYELAKTWETANPHAFKPTIADIDDWKANQIVVFLDELIALSRPLAKELVRSMGQAYRLTTSANVEVVARYYQLAIRSQDEDIYEPTIELLSKVGRMKYVRPL